MQTHFAGALWESSNTMKNKPCKPRAGAKFKHPAKLTLTVECALWSCPETDVHKMTFTYADTTCTVSEDDKEVGEVTAGMGCHVLLRDGKTHYDYCIRADDLWCAFQKALKEQKV